jgi:hypothetical protein
LAVGIGLLYAGYYWNTAPLFFCSCPATYPQCCHPPPFYANGLFDLILMVAGVLVIISSSFGLIYSWKYVKPVNREKKSEEIPNGQAS